MEIYKCAGKGSDKNRLPPAIIFPPAETYKSHDGHRGHHQVNDAGVQSFGGFMAQLLGCFGTNGTLCFHRYLQIVKKAIINSVIIHLFIFVPFRKDTISGQFQVNMINVSVKEKCYMFY